MVDLMVGKKLKSLYGHYGSISCVVGHPVEQVSGMTYNVACIIDDPFPYFKASLAIFTIIDY